MSRRSSDILHISRAAVGNPPVSLCTSLDTLQTNTYHCQIFTSNFLFENKYSTVQPIPSRGAHKTNLYNVPIYPKHRERLGSSWFAFRAKVFRLVECTMLYFVAPSALCNVQAVQACCPFSKMQKHKREVEVEDKGRRKRRRCRIWTRRSRRTMLPSDKR